MVEAIDVAVLSMDIAVHEVSYEGGKARVIFEISDITPEQALFFAHNSRIGALALAQAWIESQRGTMVGAVCRPAGEEPTKQ